MVKDNIKAYRLIARRAALGHGLDLWAKVQRDRHDILQETKAEEAKREDRTPVPARFILADGTELVPSGQEKPPKEPPTGVVTDGQVYEEAE